MKGIMKFACTLLFVASLFSGGTTVYSQTKLRGNDTLVDGRIVHIVAKQVVRKVMDATLRAPNPDGAGNPHSKFYLIVGTFIVPNNAIRLRAQLAQDGYDVSVHRCLIGGKSMYGVFVGNFRSLTEAREELETINKTYGLQGLARPLAMR
jgi:hypothetical protein